MVFSSNYRRLVDASFVVFDSVHGFVQILTDVARWNFACVNLTVLPFNSLRTTICCKASKLKIRGKIVVSGIKLIVPSFLYCRAETDLLLLQVSVVRQYNKKASYQRFFRSLKRLGMNRAWETVKQIRFLSLKMLLQTEVLKFKFLGLPYMFKRC